MKNVIEINGRNYDARTGKIISNEVNALPNASHPSTKPMNQPPVKSGAFLDGVSRRKPASYSTVVPTKPSSASLKLSAPVKKSATTNTVRALDFKPTPSKTQRANTLLRSAVKKPQKTAPQIHSTSTIAHSQVERSATGRGLLLRRIPDTRLTRAKITSKSNVIQKFTNERLTKKPILSSDLKVASPPVHSGSAPSSAPAITSVSKNTDSSKQQVFQHSIAHAINHTKTKIKKDGVHKSIARKLRVSPKAISISAAVMAVLVLGSFFVYQKVPSVAMRVAASRAGFDAKMPSTMPSGYAFVGPIDYQKNYISARFKSNSDNRKFIIMQRPTDMNSESLLSDIVTATKARYQTYNDKGLTVYILNNGDATWIDKGVWYSISSEGALSSQQILSIAGSM